MKDSYGFISCIGRSEQLFFHYSQLQNVSDQDLRIGDELEFKISLDKRSQRHVALQVMALQTGTLELTSIETDGVVGTVVKAARATQQGFQRAPEAESTNGRIMYDLDGAQNRVVFGVRDVAPVSSTEEAPREKDEVIFSIAEDRLTGKKRAINIQVTKKFVVPTVDGIVCSLKDHFGFIDRADIASEIFFHFSEFQDRDGPQVGDEVRFEITERQGKLVAVAVQLLPRGTVSFETILPGDYEGTVFKACKRSKRNDKGNPSGTISYNEKDSAEPDGSENKSDVNDAADVEDAEQTTANGSSKTTTVAFVANDVDSSAGDEQILGSGDRVAFQLAIDNRTKKKKAVGIKLIERYVRPVPDVPLEEGVIGTLKDGFGFIKCADREARMFFHFSELDGVDERSLRVGDSVQFYVVPVQSTSSNPSAQAKGEKFHAVNIKLMPFGTVIFEIEHEGKFEGVVTKAIQRQQMQGYGSRRSSYGAGAQSDRREEVGMIECISGPGGEKVTVSYKDRDTQDIRTVLQKDDRVQFKIITQRRSNSASAKDIELIERPEKEREIQSFGSLDDVKVCYGILTTLKVKEGFGFIESLEGQKETFFHNSEITGCTFNSLRHGTLVSFVESIRNGRTSGTRVVKLEPQERIDILKISDTNLVGTITKAAFNDPTTYENGSIDYGAPDLELEGSNNKKVDHVSADVEEGQSMEQIHAQIDESEATISSKLSTIYYGFGGLRDLRDQAQVGDTVEFKIATIVATGEVRAMDINVPGGSRRNRQSEKIISSERFSASVGSVKGQYGFLDFQALDTDADTLFFHVNDVAGRESLSCGDQVEFSISMNTRRQQPQAIDIKILMRTPSKGSQGSQQEFTSTQRPARMLMKLEASGSSDAPKFGMIRAPLGPDGTRGFGAGRGRALNTEGKAKETVQPGSDSNLGTEADDTQIESAMVEDA